MSLHKLSTTKRAPLHRVLALAVAAIVLTVALPINAFAATESELKQQLSDLQKKQSSINSEITALDGNIDQQEALYYEYDNALQNINQQIAIYTTQIDELAVQVDAKNEEITTKNQEIADKQAEYERTNEKFKLRLAAMYKSSSSENSLNVLFGATSFSDFLTQTEALKNISDNDKELMTKLTEQKTELENLRVELETAKAELETQKSEKESLKAEQDAKAAEQQTLRDQASALQAKLEEQKGSLEDEQAGLEASEDEISKLIAEAEAARLAAEEQARQAQQNSGSSSSGGTITGGDTGGGVSTYGWKWPVPQYSRLSQGYAGSAHWGIDIAAPEGTAIIAAASGTVVFAGQTAYGGGFGGYGNCVLISHGNGLYTLYGHASVLNVTTGQTVTQGQTIAGVGNTGNSFGNHCHFEVRNGAQGSRLNPMNYVSEPR